MKNDSFQKIEKLQNFIFNNIEINKNNKNVEIVLTIDQLKLLDMSLSYYSSELLVREKIIEYNAKNKIIKNPIKNVHEETENNSFNLKKLPRIIRNSAKCNKCGEEIESKYRHDFVRCKCGAIFVDGGKEYRRVGFDKPEDFEDTSIVQEIKISN